MIRSLVFLAFISAFSLPAHAQLLQEMGQYEVMGELFEDGDVSGAGIVGNRLVICADEGGRVQMLESFMGRLRVVGDVPLAEDKPEADFEAIATEGDTVYVIGSHARKRKRAKADETPAENRQRIEEVEREQSREVLFRFRVTGDGQVRDIERSTLMPFFEEHPILERFTKIPGKENGLNIEGLAVRDGWLYVGLRAPVLRDNLVPIIKCRFAAPTRAAEVLYVDLAGYGIRDMAAVDGGFLIVAGPSGDRRDHFAIHFWDGRDQLALEPDDDRRRELFPPLALLQAPDDGKFEGIALVREDDSLYEFIAWFDSLKNGGPRRYRLLKPRE